MRNSSKTPTPASARYSPQPSRAEDQINAHEFVNPRESGDSRHVKQRRSDARRGDSLFHSCCRKATALNLLESVILNLESLQSSSARRHRKLGRYSSKPSISRTSTSIEWRTDGRVPLAHEQPILGFCCLDRAANTYLLLFFMVLLVGFFVGFFIGFAASLRN